MEIGKIGYFRGNYYFLSNFYTCNIEFDGITYQNAEAAFQAQKCTDVELKKEFANLSPDEAKRKGRRVNLRTDWEKVKLDIMYRVVRAKFTQNQDLKEKLLATGYQYLEEGNTWGDRFWGTVNGAGENKLGKILMTIREELRSDEEKVDMSK